METVERAGEFGIHAEMTDVEFADTVRRSMRRCRTTPIRFAGGWNRRRTRPLRRRGAVRQRPHRRGFGQRIAGRGRSSSEHRHPRRRGNGRRDGRQRLRRDRRVPPDERRRRPGARRYRRRVPPEAQRQLRGADGGPQSPRGRPRGGRLRREAVCGVRLSGSRRRRHP